MRKLAELRPNHSEDTQPGAAEEQGIELDLGDTLTMFVFPLAKAGRMAGPPGRARADPLGWVSHPHGSHR